MSTQSQIWRLGLGTRLTGLPSCFSLSIKLFVCLSATLLVCLPATLTCRHAWTVWWIDFKLNGWMVFLLALKVSGQGQLEVKVFFTATCIIFFVIWLLCPYHSTDVHRTVLGIVRVNVVAIYLHDLELMVILGSRSLLKGFRILFDMEWSLILNRTMNPLETWWVGRHANIP